MSAPAFFLLFCGVLLNAAAQLLLKAGVNAVGPFAFRLETIVAVGWRLAMQWPIIAGLGCYVISVVVWILGLSRVDVSVAYPMLSLGYVVNAVLAWYLFGEIVTMQRAVGIAIILVGVFIVARSASPS